MSLQIEAQKNTKDHVELSEFVKEWTPPTDQEKWEIMEYWRNNTPLKKGKEQKRQFPLLPSLEEGAQLTQEQLNEDWETARFFLWHEYRVTPMDTVVFHRLQQSYGAHVTALRKIYEAFMPGKFDTQLTDIFDITSKMTNGETVSVTTTQRRTIEDRIERVVDAFQSTSENFYKNKRNIKTMITTQINRQMKNIEDTVFEDSLSDIVTVLSRSPTRRFKTHQEASFSLNTRQERATFDYDNYEPEYLHVIVDFLAAASSRPEVPKKLYDVLYEGLKKDTVKRVYERQITWSRVDSFRSFVRELEQARILSLYQLEDNELYIVTHEPEQSLYMSRINMTKAKSILTKVK